jgi:hypothetical protein
MTQATKVSKVSPEQMISLDRRCNEWLELASSNTPTDRTQTKEAINELYGQSRLPSHLLVSKHLANEGHSNNTCIGSPF